MWEYHQLNYLLKADYSKHSHAGLALALYGPVQSNMVWLGPVRCFICKFNMAPHIWSAKFKGKTCLAFK